MVRTENNGSLSLRLIDFESLAELMDANELTDYNHSFHSQFDTVRREEMDALTFLWWQCMLIAYVWLGEIKLNDLDARNFVFDCCQKEIANHFPGLTGDDLSKLNLTAAGGEISVETITSTIEVHLKPLFEKKVRKRKADGDECA